LPVTGQARGAHRVRDESSLAPSIAARALAARRSAIREVFDAANRIPDAIRLEIGEPSFPTPRFVVDAAMEAARAGKTGYTPNGGYASLREALAAKIERVDGFAVDPDGVVVTPGAMNALFSIYLALLEPGDEVLLPTPGFPNMDEMVRLLGGEPVFYRLDRAAGYVPSREQLEGLVTSRTKAIFANTPGNPTGAVFPAETVRGLAELAAETGVWLISDEVYDELILDDVPHVSAASLVPEAPIVSVYSFSKVYAMTGWRLGYCAAPEALAAVLRKLQEPEVSCPSAISQHAAAAVLAGPRNEFDAMRDAYRERRDRALEAAAEHGLDVFRTQGTFYMLVDVAASGLPAREFTLRALDELHVAVAPGEVFGPGCEELVRISFGVEADVLVEGMARIARAIETFAA
jgi:aspartate/methionine/tyrosine aminotransferase